MNGVRCTTFPGGFEWLSRSLMVSEYFHLKVSFNPIMDGVALYLGVALFLILLLPSLILLCEVQQSFVKHNIPDLIPIP